jgi:hypothetical protein
VGAFRAAIPQLVSLKLRHAEIKARLCPPREDARRVPMPETAMNKYDLVELSEYHVWSSG